MSVHHVDYAALWTSSGVGVVGGRGEAAGQRPQPQAALGLTGVDFQGEIVGQQRFLSVLEPVAVIGHHPQVPGLPPGAPESRQFPGGPHQMASGARSSWPGPLPLQIPSPPEGAVRMAGQPMQMPRQEFPPSTAATGPHLPESPPSSSRRAIGDFSPISPTQWPAAGTSRSSRPKKSSTAWSGTLMCVPCPMCSDERVKLELYIDHVTTVHRVTNLSFMKRLWRQTKKEMEVILDRESLFDAKRTETCAEEDERSRSLTRKFNRLLEGHWITAPEAAGRNGQGGEGQASNRKAADNGQGTHVVKRARLDKPESSAVNSMTNEKLVPDTENQHDAEIADCNGSGSLGVMGKDQLNSLLQRFACSECPFVADSSAEVYQHFLSSHPSEAELPDFTPQRLHLIPVLQRVDIQDASSRITIFTTGDEWEDSFEASSSRSQVVPASDAATDVGSDDSSLNFFVLTSGSSSPSDEDGGDDDGGAILPGVTVWAKMTGYPWWPGIVMPEPNSSRFFNEAKDEYHVLFFQHGQRLQRAWVSAAKVERLDEEAIHPGGAGPPVNRMPSKRSKYHSEVESALVWVGRVRGLSNKRRKKMFTPYLGGE